MRVVQIVLSQSEETYHGIVQMASFESQVLLLSIQTEGVYAVTNGDISVVLGTPDFKG